MKPRWLLLAASLVCLLVLAPASMLSAQGIPVGCGTADIHDGVLDPDEWAPAAVIPAAPAAGAWAGGDFLVMNDLDAVYIGSHMDVAGPGLVTDPLFWNVHAFDICFADEDAYPAFAGTICPTSEGCYFLDASRAGPFAATLSAAWTPFREGPPGGLPCPPVPIGPGVDWNVIPTDDFDIEALIAFGESELDSMGPGDCVPMGFYLNATAVDPSIPASSNAQQEWPATLGAAVPNGWPDAFGLICLSDCEPDEEFVPEPGTVMLLASGLMGMAGYVGLRLRKK